VVCKKWHVAKRLVDSISHGTNIPVVEYIFNEEDAPLPDLGGLQRTLAKRNRHRRALMRMLFEFFETDRLIVCMDPGNFYLLEDFGSDRSGTRILELECDDTDEFLIGHSKRIGLAGEQTPEETLQRLLPTIRNEIAFEKDQLHDANFDSLFTIKESDSAQENAGPLAEFLGISQEKAQQIADTPYLFSD
jgi:hypothetical protein